MNDYTPPSQSRTFPAIISIKKSIQWNLWILISLLPFILTIYHNHLFALYPWFACPLAVLLISGLLHRFFQDQVLLLRNFFFCFLLLPSWISSALICANRFLDSSPALENHSRFLHIERRHKGPDRVIIKSWKDSSSTIWFSINSSLNLRFALTLERGDPLIIKTHRGILGWEWIESIAPQQKL